MKSHNAISLQSKDGIPPPQHTHFWGFQLMQMMRPYEKGWIHIEIPKSKVFRVFALQKAFGREKVKTIFEIRCLHSKDFGRKTLDELKIQTLKKINDSHFDNIFYFPPTQSKILFREKTPRNPRW